MAMTNDRSNLRADAQRNYERLLKAAESILVSQGAFTSLEAVAKRAGVGIGTLYRHFPTRKTLLEAVYADKISELLRLATPTTTSNPEVALISWLKTMANYTVQNHGFDTFIKLALEDDNSPIVATGNTLLTRAQKAGRMSSDVTILDLLRLVTAIAASDTPKSDIRRVDNLVTSVVRGFSKPAAENSKPS
jgi:AcrR family transcriptional regulator